MLMKLIKTIILGKSGVILVVTTSETKLEKIFQKNSLLLNGLFTKYEDQYTWLHCGNAGRAIRISRAVPRGSNQETDNLLEGVLSFDI